jgi:hypothetical protein
MRSVLFLIFLISLKVQAFIPPVSAVLKEIFDERKFSDDVEFGFSHQVLGGSGEWSEIEERIVLDRRGPKFLWKVGANGTWISGQLEKRNYLVGDKKISARSLLFLKSFIANSAVEFRDALISERFLRWDQLKQFKDGFELQGEPQTWDIKTNYLQQDSIYLVLLPSGPSIAVIGSQDGNSKRTVYFDKALQSLKRLEWAGGSDNFTWNFDSSLTPFKEAVFPKRSYLLKEEREMIQSELIVIRQLNSRKVKEWRQLWQRSLNSSSASLDDNLKTLLSYR